MFERFTDRARRVVVVAQEHARELGHTYIGTEHVLLAVLDENDGIAPKVVDGLGVGRATIRGALMRAIEPGSSGITAGQIPFTPRVKSVIEASLREAARLGHRYIGVEHLLLALVEGKGIAATVLAELGITHENVRTEIVSLFGLEQVERLAKASGTAKALRQETIARMTAGARLGAKCPSCGAALARESSYEIVDAPQFGGEGTAKVLYLFCVGCGHVLDTVILPDER